jgi:hypothetical protein
MVLVRVLQQEQQQGFSLCQHVSERSKAKMRPGHGSDERPV